MRVSLREDVSEREKSVTRPAELLEVLCPGAYDRLLADFCWRVWNQNSRAGDRAWVEFHHGYFTSPAADTVGLNRAVTAAMTLVQHELYSRGGVPFESELVAAMWNRLRALAVDALLDDVVEPPLVKQREAAVAPDGRARAICIGGVSAQVFEYDGATCLGPGYWGCLRAFLDRAPGRGKPWPMCCPECRRVRTNLERKYRARRVQRWREADAQREASRTTPASRSGRLPRAR